MERSQKISAKEKTLTIVYSGIGASVKADIEFAAGPAVIYGFHIKTEPKALESARESTVTIRLFGIIYKFLEDVQQRIDQSREVKMVSVKVGEAVVRKIFNIKKLGVIAGCYVKAGLRR